MVAITGPVTVTNSPEVRATAAVFVNGHFAGTAVLIDQRYLLTAAHVVKPLGQTAPTGQVQVQFPSIVGSEGGEAQVQVQRVLPQSGPITVDATVLDLGEQSPEWLPSPIPLSPTRRVPKQVRVFGFPRHEKELKGVWRDFDTSGPTTVGTVQLDWVRPVGTQVGHSGGPVLDPLTGAVVGVLVEGSVKLQFDRFVPAGVIAECHPDLPRPWMLSGSDPAGEVEHFRLRALGQRSLARGGDLFRGRHAALTAVREMLMANEAPGCPLVVTGQPGAGKSAVVARAVLDLQTKGRGPGVAFHARGATHIDLLKVVADLTGVERANSPYDLISILKARSDGPWLVVVDALDEAFTREERKEIAELLGELAVLPSLRVAVATRALATGPRENPYRLGELLPALGVTSPDSQQLVDLDTDRYFDPSGLYDYAAALLNQSGAEHPGPPGHAWSAYRADPALRARLASAITKRADRNYLVVAMAAYLLSTQPNVVDPAAPGFDRAMIPSSVGEALDKYLDGLDERHRVRVLGLLSTLAYARGPGIDNDLWIQFARALGYPVSIEDLDELLHSAAADYLLQPTHADNGIPVTRLFHEALTDQLLQRRQSRRSDEHRLLKVLISSVDGDWSQASGYARSYASDHAAACDQLPTLLDDPQFLAVADLTRLLPLLPARPDHSLAPIVAVLRQISIEANSLLSSQRTRLLALTAARNGLHELHRRLADACGSGLVPRWSHAIGTPHQSLAGHDETVRAVAIGRVDGLDVVASGSNDHTVRIWDATTGQPIGDPLEGHTGTVRAVAVGGVDGLDVVASGSNDHTVRIWDATTGQPIGDPLEGHTGSVSAVALGSAGDRDIIVSGSEDETLQIWDATTHDPIGDPLESHIGGVQTVAVGRVGDRDIIVSGSEDETLQVWDATTHDPVGAPIVGHHGGVSAVAVGSAGDRDIIVSASNDPAAQVRVWDATTHDPVGAPIVGHHGGVSAVAVGSAGDRDIIVSGNGDRLLQVWDAVTHEPVGAPIVGHHGRVRAVAVGRAGDRDIIASGSSDCTVMVWDDPVGTPIAGHGNAVRAVAVGRAGGRHVVVSGSNDNSVGIWDAATGQPIGNRLEGHTRTVRAVAAGRVTERDIIVSGSSDGRVVVWDADTHEPIREPLVTASAVVRAVALGCAAGRSIIACGVGTHLQVWDADTHEPIRNPISHSHPVNTLAVGQAGDREIIVSGGQDQALRIRDAVTGQTVTDTLYGHTDSVSAVAVGRVGDREVIVSGSNDRTVRIWDATTGQPIGDPLRGHTGSVSAVAVGRVGDRDVIVSGSNDRTVRIWDASGSPVDVVDQLVPVHAVALASNGVLCIAAGTAICAACSGE
ncbi:trypsin-like serine protease [Streptomyces sp. A3M-1-3]|uniref:trypsin-like serine protease n=1 Tax=Streptomyces sp. A3M-1-3 TaxID=2962044 RepID=UPI0020B795E3|nr:trypsin-like serine protease [Streptomyces sp. A3M-1-3]MCP3822664.1 trypsin-like serine protease [Streptomyces sp. A3M-1-3]